ncbi:MAG TPA: hypothetical protein VGB30_05755 [bacterium]|jgi:hypothetical protein
MSGNPRPLSRDINVHLVAARDWIGRAEKQFSDGQGILASSTLLLAQAELKIVVERTALTVAPMRKESKTAKKAVLPIRQLVTVGAMAACLVIGLALGKFTVVAPAVEIPDSVNQSMLAENTSVPEAGNDTGSIPNFSILPELTNDISNEDPILLAGADPSAETPVTNDHPAFTNTVYSPPAVSRVPDTMEPVDTAADEPAVIITADEPDMASTEHVRGGEKVDSDKISLNVVRSLSERILGEHTE